MKPGKICGQQEKTQSVHPTHKIAKPAFRSWDELLLWVVGSKQLSQHWKLYKEINNYQRINAQTNATLR